MFTCFSACSRLRYKKIFLKQHSSCNTVYTKSSQALSTCFGAIEKHQFVIDHQTVIIDLNSVEVYLGIVAVPVYFPPLQLKNATAKSSNSMIFPFLVLATEHQMQCRFSNWLPIQMTLCMTLTLLYIRILSYSSVPARQSISKFLHKLA